MTAKKAAEVVETETPQGVALERIVDLTSNLLLIVSTIIVVVGWVMVGVGATMTALYGLVVNVAIFVFLRAVAEILRVLKHAAGLPIEGSISGMRTRIRRSCGGCGAELFSATRCDACGRELVGDAAAAESGHAAGEPRASEGPASP